VHERDRDEGAVRAPVGVAAGLERAVGGPRDEAVGEIAPGIRRSVNEMIMPGRRLRAEVGTVMMTSPGLTTGAIEPDMITSARNPATWASSYQTVAQQNSASTKTAPARVRSRIISCSGLAS
jgi:hypothetical protein